MADISGILGAIDGALGQQAPRGNGASAYPTAPATDSAGSPAPLDTDVIVRTPPRPRIVPGVAPAGDPNATASPLASAIYTGGQAPTAAPQTAAPSDVAPQKSVAQQAIDAIDAALAEPTKPQPAAAPAAAQPSRKPTIQEVVASPAIGFNEALADTVGAPVDLVNWGMGKVGLPISQTPFGGSQSIKQGLGLIGANPDEHPANSTIERIGRGAGAGAAAMLLPAAGLAGATEAGLVAPRVATALGEAIGAPTTGGQAAGLSGIGAASGAAGQGAEEVAPAKYAPLANLAGNLAGGGLAAGLGAGVGLLGKGAGAVGDFVAPLTAGGRQRTADQRIFKGATSPVASLDALENNPRELVPGSKPTTFQLTGDRGLGQMERQAAKKAPAPFLERMAEQNAARVGAIKGVAPVGDPQAVASMFKSHLAALDEMAGAVEGAARKNAAEAETAAREAAAKGEASAKSVAQTKVAELGGQGTPEAYGSELRARLQDAKDAAKASERALWKAVDPDGKLALDATPVSAAARRIVGELSPLAAPMNADEAGAFRAALSMNGGRRFSDVVALRTRLNEAMREELSTKGETATYRRLTMLRGAVEEAISGAVEQKATQEASAVAAGTLAPEDAMASSLQAEADAFQRTRAEAARVDASQNYSANSGGGSARIPRSVGAEIPSGRGSANPPGDQGVSGELAPNFTQADRERLAAATAATKQRAATFGADPIGKILQTQGTKGAYRIADSALGEKIFPSGPGGAEAVQKFMAAAGDNPASQAQLRDLAAASLRRFAGQQDGTLHPGRTVAWIKGHQDALRGVPGLAERFIGAGRASLAIDDASAAGKAAIKDAVARGQDAIEEAAAARRQSINDYQKGLIGKLIGSDNPTDTTRMIGSIFGRPDSVKLMRRVATEARGNPEAIEGLKKAIVDHIRENFLTTRAEDGQTVEGIKGEAFKRFVSNNLGPLSQVFDPKDVAGIRLVADDLARSDQSIRTKLPGQSNTAQDTAHDEAAHNSLGLLTEAMVVGGETGRHLGAHGAIGHAIGFLGGAGAVIGKAIVSVMRASGMRTVDDAISEMLLHPDLAAAGIRRAMSKEEAKANAITFAQKLRRVSVFAPSLAEEFSQDHKGKH